MSALQKITKIKRQLEEIAAEDARQKGVLEERKRALKDLCGTDDIAKASKKLEAMLKEFEDEEVSLESAIAKFEERYADLLN